MMNKTKPILCLDFDGVLHSYESGWQGADTILDSPVPGAVEFIHRASEFFRIAVYSSRSHQPGGMAAMKKWLHKAIIDADFDGSLFDVIEWPDHKPAAFLTIDDRAMRFTGKWPVAAELLDFKPWNKS